MKRWKKIALGVVIALIAAATALCLWQWDNIRAAYLALSQDSQQIAEDAQQKRDEHQAAIQERVPVTVNPPTAQQSDSLLNQQTTPEEIKDQLGITGLLEQSGQQQGQTGQPQQGQSGQEPQPPEQSEQELVNLCLAEMYACKIDLMAVLGQLKQEAVAEWTALPEAERTRVRKIEIGLAGLSKCYELEGQADGQVKDILARYREQLSAIGGDLTILDDIWDYYVEEKASEKAYYIGKYMN